MQSNKDILDRTRRGHSPYRDSWRG